MLQRAAGGDEYRGNDMIKALTQQRTLSDARRADLPPAPLSDSPPAAARLFH